MQREKLRKAFDVAALVDEMTLDEKAALTAGADMWSTAGVERLGIPAIKVTDGPNGARGDGLFSGGVPATSFPVGIALAATWNTALVEEIGVALGEEAKTKGARVLLAPTVNIHRTPVNGRNFECYSEDPYLTAELAVAYVKGVQSQQIAATIKHFVCNDSEYQRNSISSEVGERALREIYLPPFKAAVRKAGVWALMSSYNRVNGTFASENRFLLHDILRDEWGWDGLVMSDWFGTKSTAASVNAGQDLEMPGPAIWRGDKLLQAVRDGEVSEATIDERARNVLRLIERVGAFENPDIPAEQAVDLPKHRALIRRAGAEAGVLHKHDGILPFDSKDVQTLAIIGPNAKTARVMGGGSAQIKAHYSVTPFDGIFSRPGAPELCYEIGTTNHKNLPAIQPSQFEGGKVAVAYFNNTDLSGEAAAHAQSSALDFLWFGRALPESINPFAFSMRATARFSVPETGTYQFSVACSGKARLSIDGVPVVDNWTRRAPGSFLFGMGAGDAYGTAILTAGKAYTIQLEYTTEGFEMLSGVRVGVFLPLPDDSIQRAASLAAESDAAVVFIGLNGEWESEGFDRANIELTGEQNALVEAVAAAHPRTVVVVQTGSPITMPWLDNVAAVLQAWYPGQECGNAVSDVLFGDVTPSGKLPQTFPQRLEDNPADINYPGETGRVHYGEGIFVGYRYYEKKRLAPLFPFGFGLSYTTFGYSNLRLSATAIHPDETLHVSVDVTNTGARGGPEIVPLYVRDDAATVQRPEKELKAFAKVALQPGETRTVTLALDRDAFAFFQDVERCWVVEAGIFEILVGASSADIRARARVTLTDTIQFDPSSTLSAPVAPMAIPS
jgi:beta-glucosidase